MRKQRVKARVAIMVERRKRVVSVRKVVPTLTSKKR
jgi:hypothetical protein